jgi:hypothetical protein
MFGPNGVPGGMPSGGAAQTRRPQGNCSRPWHFPLI